MPADVSADVPHFLPDEYVTLAAAKLDLYRRMTTADPAALEALRLEVRDRFGPLPPPAQAYFSVALLRAVGGELGIEGILVRGNEARVTFSGSAVPRMKGLAAAFHGVQFQADVKRAHPLSLKLTRLGGAGMLDGLVQALRGLLQAGTSGTSGSSAR